MIRICASPILVLIVLTVSLNAQPKSGDWRVSTRFGQFVFTVNSTGTQIIKLATTFSNYTFGGVTQNGTVVSQVSPGWPISNSQFALTTSINPTGTTKLNLNGTFTPVGDQASGTWSMLVSGQTDAGTWGPVIFTSVKEVASGIAERFLLEQNYPNPFNPRTTIRYELPKESPVSLKVFSLLGEGVAILDEGVRPPGVYTVQFDASQLASGVYLYRLQACEHDATKKLVVLE